MSLLLSQSQLVVLGSLLASLGCATASTHQAAVPTTRTGYYHYVAQLDRTFDPATIGFAGQGIREFKADMQFWVSVSQSSVPGDSVHVIATIDSAQTAVRKQIPEVPIPMPPTFGQGTHVDFTFARHSLQDPIPTKDSTSALSPTSKMATQLLYAILPALLPNLITPDTTPGQSIDTTYAQQPVKAIHHTITDTVFRYGFVGLSLNASRDTSQKATVSDVHGNMVQYFSANGTLLGVKAERSYKTETPIDIMGPAMLIGGTAMDSATVTRLGDKR